MLEAQLSRYIGERASFLKTMESTEGEEERLKTLPESMYGFDPTVL